MGGNKNDADNDNATRAFHELFSLRVFRRSICGHMEPGCLGAPRCEGCRDLGWL